MSHFERRWGGAFVYATFISVVWVSGIVLLRHYVDPGLIVIVFVVGLFGYAAGHRDGRQS